MPTLHSHTHCQAAPANATTQAWQRVCLSNRTAARPTCERKEQRRHNSSYKKLAVQWLIEALCFVSSSVVADSFRLRNRQLLVAANRYATLKKQNGQKWTDHPKSENVKVETEIKEKVNRVTKIERVEKEKIY